MDFVNVLPPQLSGVLRAQVLPQAQLAEIFEDDLVALDVGVAGLDCAVFASAIAVVVQVFLVTLHALPEDVVGGELGILVKLLAHASEVFQEVEGSVR